MNKSKFTHLSFRAINPNEKYLTGLDPGFPMPNEILEFMDCLSSTSYKENVKNGWLPLHPTVYIKKECMDKWGLYDESYKIAADSDLLVRYLYEADLKVYYLNKYIVKMRMGGLSTDAGKSKLKWAEDLRMYKSHGIKPISALKGKILSKIPQFIEARLPWSEIPEAEEESLIQPAAANKKE